jgi:tetratricopeptide (TPR) repeat protein
MRRNQIINNKHLPAALAVLASFLLYLPTLRSGFIWDDNVFITNPLAVGSTPYAPYFGKGIYFRPFLQIINTLDFSLWHLNPVGWHVTNICLHAVNTLLVYLLAYKIVGGAIPGVNEGATPGANESATPGVTGGAIERMALVSALLFALHPIHIESVAWISGRTDILATMFFIPAFLSFMMYEERADALSLVLFGLFYMFSLFCKENAVALIPVVLAYGIILKMPKRRIFLSILILSTLTAINFLALRGGHSFQRVIATPGKRGAFFSSVGSGLNADAILEAVKKLVLGAGYYVEKIIAPFNLNLLPDVPSNPLYIVFLILPLAVGLVFVSRRRGVELFLLLWAAATLLPSLAILFSSMASPIGERYLYLPSVGFVILAAMGLGSISNRRIFIILTSAILIVYTAASAVRLNDWQSNSALWEATVRQNPESIGARVNLASEQMRLGLYDDARLHLLKTLEKKNLRFFDLSNVFYLLGSIELERENYDSAQRYLENSIKADNGNMSAYYELGLTNIRRQDVPGLSEVLKRGYLDRAVFYLEKAVKMSPRFIYSRYNLALSYFYRQEPDKAVEYFNSVIELDPQGELADKSSRILAAIDAHSKTPKKATR